MESLYRKYRPQTFADVVGQQHVVGTLQRAVLEGRTSHAYLFCGPRGTGKTTMARLLAKALMCEQGAGHLPDGTCEQCQRIAAGEHPDVYELDAASRTGVDSVREEIINNVSYAPTQGSYKVYIIDEVHMLTTAAFNALLKTLEEPPEHVVFVLCTTDPQKVPATILSRVQRFDFRPIGNEDILKHLVYVCEQEGFTYEDAALELVTRNARGGMRDALSTLEQLSVFGGGVIGLDAAQDLLGAVSGGALDQVVQAVAARDVSALFVQVGELVNAGRDLLQFTRELAAHLRDVYVVASVGANPAVLPEGADVAKLQAQAAAFGPADRVARILALLGDVSREMAVAPNQRLVLEIAFVRMARPESDLTLESLAERIAVLEQRLASGGGGGAVVASAPVAAAAAQVPASASTTPDATPAGPAPTPTPAPAQRTAPTSAPASQQAEPTAQPAPTRTSQQAPGQASTAQGQAPAPQPTHTRSAAPQTNPAAQAGPATQAAPAAQAQPASPTIPAAQAGQAVTDSGALQRSWRKVVSELVARIPARGTLLTNAVATADDGTKLTVSLPKGSTFALKMLERPDVRAIVEGVVNEVFGRRSIEYVEGTSSDLQVPAYAARQSAGATPAQQPASQYPPQRQQPQAQLRVAGCPKRRAGRSVLRAGTLRGPKHAAGAVRRNAALRAVRARFRDLLGSRARAGTRARDLLGSRARAGTATAHCSCARGTAYSHAGAATPSRSGLATRANARAQTGVGPQPRARSCARDPYRAPARALQHSGHGVRGLWRRCACEQKLATVNSAPAQPVAGAREHGGTLWTCNRLWSRRALCSSSWKAPRTTWATWRWRPAPVVAWYTLPPRPT